VVTTDSLASAFELLTVAEFGQKSGRTSSLRTAYSSPHNSHRPIVTPLLKPYLCINTQQLKTF